MNLSFPRKEATAKRIYTCVRVLPHLSPVRFARLWCSNSPSTVVDDNIREKTALDPKRAQRRTSFNPIHQIPTLRAFPSFISLLALAFAELSAPKNHSHHDTTRIFALARVGATPRPGSHHLIFHDRSRFSSQPRFGVLRRHYQWFSRHAHSGQGRNSKILRRP